MLCMTRSHASCSHMQGVQRLSCFYRGRWGPETLSNLPKVTELSGGARIQTQICLTPKLLPRILLSPRNCADSESVCRAMKNQRGTEMGEVLG